jgi:class 3 adenylate cyclase
MRCPRCDADTPEGMKFYIECAALLTRRCPQCAFANPPQAKFCGQCATPLTGQTPTPHPFSAPHPPLSYTPGHLAEKILTSKAALEGERKQVTVLFADLKGSRELLADRDPEEARQLLDPVLERMIKAVHRYEGTVNQVLGDGIIALFGAPVAHEDHAVRDCYAALAMQEAVRHYREEVRRSHGIEVQIRVGLHSGEVVVRSIGNDLHMDYSAIGQTTHLAARMEQLATPGSIRLTAATLRLVEGLVRVNTLGPVPIKGVAQAVEVFELVSATAVRQRLQAAACGLTRFVGRETEMTTLAQALARAGRGHGQLVAAVGEAGVGKSLLLYEFVHSHHTQGWLALEAASVSYGKAALYYPVVDLLKRYMHVEDGDEPRTVRAKVTGHLLTLDEMLQLTRQYQQRGTQAWALWLLGESTAHRTPLELEPAEDNYQQALALAEELDMRPLQAHCHRGLGTQYAKIGPREPAGAELSAAIALYREMEMTFWLPQAEEALAQMERR